MKKNGLFKLIAGTLLLAMILTFAIPGSSGERNYLGIGTAVISIAQTLSYFTDTIVLILLIGGFYGILNKTGAYKKLIDSIVTKYKDNKNFLVAVIIIFALIASLTGISLPLFIFVPFVISIILLMGYDKLVALASTIGAILVGLLGGIFVTFVDFNSYTFSLITLEDLLDLEKYSNIFPKIFLLVIAVGLLVLYVFKHIKAVEEKKVKYEIKDDTDILITEVKGSYKNIKVWPLITVFSVVILFLILGLTPWNSLFGLDIFNKFHDWILGIKIGDFSVFGNIISNTFPALGNWLSIGNVGNQLMTINLLVVATIAIAIIYRVKLEDALNGFVEGMRKMVPTASMMILALAVLVFVFNNGFMTSIVKWTVDLTGGFNVALSSSLVVIGSFLHVDYFYTIVGVLSPLMEQITDTAVNPVLAVMFQSLYYLTMLIAPTSVILVAALTYLNVPYKEWFKFIWRLALELLIVIFVILCILLII